MIKIKEGYLKVNVYADDVSQPIEGAKVEIINTGKTYETDENGQTGSINLETYPKENSLIYNTPNPYKTYDIKVSKETMSSVIIKGIEIFEGIKSIQDVYLTSSDENDSTTKEISIDPIVISGSYTSKYKENENSSSTFVLKNPIIPEYVIVHDGIPNDNTAPNYYVPFADYIKNVATSEIYPTWPIETLKANILAIMSFTLNRVFTEWYPSKGYNFTMTSVTAYDQKYVHMRSIADTISSVVDDLVGNYLKRPNKIEPMLAQYCDGETLKEENWLWQWGSANLGEQKVPAFDILKYYYGTNLSIETATFEEGLPTSFPGTVLGLGSCGEDVKMIQNEINIVRGSYPGLTEVTNPNGEFDKNTEDAVKKFQDVFNISVTGVVDYTTWYRISYMYIAVARMINGVYDRT